ncbi:MAG: hypothetical protein HQ538_00190 [Parcubacteria group bacterium]|nr:hypothetical protein [Parcubacteria group bacterium]
MIYYVWLINKRIKFIDSINYIYLAITVPPESEKNPSSMEQVLAGFYGVESGKNFVEKYFKGEVQVSLSLELVSINGNVRFIIRTPDYYRDLVEASIYSQYPEAEITEVEDYTKFAPDTYPNDKYQMYGLEFGLAQDDAYPIRTYYEFEDKLGDKENKFIDPLSVLTEMMSRLGEGEQLWIQFVIRPIRNQWKKKGEKVVAKLIGKAVEEKTSIAEMPIKSSLGLFHGLTKGLESTLGFQANEAERGMDIPNMMQYLSPGEQRVVEAIENSLAKTGYDVKFRWIYIARKEVFNKARGAAPIFGAVSLFNDQYLNGFRLREKTISKAEYFRRFRDPIRSRRLMRNYKLRRIDQMASPFVLNIEEIATVFHFPYTTVMAPSVSHAELKTKEPPPDLPVG